MNTTTRSVALGAAVALVIIASVFGWQYFIAHKQPTPEQTYQVPPPGGLYTNEQYRFSLTLPEGFEAREVGDAVVIEDGQGNGVQIVVTPINEDIFHLTKARIEADVPDLEVRESQAVELGGGRTGLTFVSDNQAFDGTSREVWFVYPEPEKGTPQLYQLSTYQSLDVLLQSMFSTWEFF